jgi:WD40 repeat protein
VPGIDFCSYAANSYLGGPLSHAEFVFFIWGDFCGGAGGGYNVSVDGLKFHGFLRNQVGDRHVGFAGETKDGKTGRATVEGKEYDLADGTLFLVSARRGYRVKQLKRDLTRFHNADELFRELSKNDPDIMEFFPTAVTMSPDGRWTAVARNGVISLQDTQTDKVVEQYAGHNDAITSLAFSPDSKVLASGGKDKLVLLWGIPGGDPHKRLDVPSPVYHVEFSGEGKTLTVREVVSLTATTWETTWREFDVASGKQVRDGGEKTSSGP